MSLATNTRDQLVKRLARDIVLTIASASTQVSQCASADAVIAGESPAILVSIGGVAVAYIAFLAKAFNGFQVVAELSSSSANGLPETDLFVQFNQASAAYNVDILARLVYAAGRIGCATLNIINSASYETLDGSQILYANITTQIVNDSRAGGVGA
jgi:hypothetical protein